MILPVRCHIVGGCLSEFGCLLDYGDEIVEATKDGIHINFVANENKFPSPNPDLERAIKCQTIM